MATEVYNESWKNLRAAHTFFAPDITLVMVSQPPLPKRTKYLHLAQFNFGQTLEKSELPTSGTIKFGPNRVSSLKSSRSTSNQFCTTRTPYDTHQIKASRSLLEPLGASQNFSKLLRASYLPSGLPFGRPPDKYLPCLPPACSACFILSRGIRTRGV